MVVCFSFVPLAHFGGSLSLATPSSAWLQRIKQRIFWPASRAHTHITMHQHLMLFLKRQSGSFWHKPFKIPKCDFLEPHFYFYCAFKSLKKEAKRVKIVSILVLLHEIREVVHGVCKLRASRFNGVCNVKDACMKKPRGCCTIYVPKLACLVTQSFGRKCTI